MRADIRIYSKGPSRKLRGYWVFKDALDTKYKTYPVGDSLPSEYIGHQAKNDNSIVVAGVYGSSFQGRDTFSLYTSYAVFKSIYDSLLDE